MKRLFKWLLIIGGAFLVLIIAAVIIIPQFVDINKYKPVIEQKVAEATGRSFTLGDEMDLSVFPWVGVKLTDLHLGNPDGYKQKDMVSVKNFEVRLKVMPLLSKKIEIKTFVLDG
ncbi:MAG: AsmA family protein, partial [Desulfobacula sp.]|nr:AsmA family protein [Desulfobacula sp.]